MKLQQMLPALITMILCLPLSTWAQDDVSIKEKWAPLVNQDYYLEFFDGFFVNLGIEVKETGEQVTVKRKADIFEITEGIDESMVDYTIQISTQNIHNLSNHAKDNKLDDTEKFSILAVMFTPITAKSLSDPTLEKNVPRFVKKKENNLHVTLYSPDKKASVSHTILYLNKEWIVVPGLHGTPKRIYTLDVPEAMLYQKKVFEALKANNKKDWKAFRRWYVEWREKVSVEG